jgi:hypothetical protein
VPDLVVYVDVDDTLVRTAGSKRIPIPASIARIRELKAKGAMLYLWSTAGADYALATATELGLSDCFVAYLPKPNLIIDDQEVSEWRETRHIYPHQDV